jgi:hypothetical protein
MIITRLLASLALLLCACSQLLAGEAADLTRQHFEAGTLAAGERTLADRLAANPADIEARYGLGLVRFGRALEKFGQHHYRYGLQPMGEHMFPFLRMPVPPNPNAETLTYEAQRAALQAFIDDLAAVESTLADTGEEDIKLVLDMETIRLDLTGAGTPGSATPLLALLRSVSFLQTPGGGDLAEQPADPSAPLTAPGADASGFEVAFDRADMLWLRGYCRLLSAGLEFVLAYEWRDTFARAAGLFYPKLRQGETADETSLDDLVGMGGSAALIADTIAMIHEVRWQPIEAVRLKRARDDLKAVTRLSRASWQAILAETDDDREWIPSPRQKQGVFTSMTITRERVTMWLAALGDFDAVLDGTKLLPHWRLSKGINLRRVVDEPRPFDLVLWITGHAAAPYMEDGPVISSESWRLWQQVFNGDFLLFAVYFN